MNMTYGYLMDDDSEHKKTKGTKKCAIKRGFVFKNYKDCNFHNKTILKSQQRFKNDYHNVYTEQINKIALIVMMIRDCKHLINLQQYISDHPYRILIIGGSGSGKTNALLNLINK